MEPNQERKSWLDVWMARWKRFRAWAEEDLRKDTVRYGLPWPTREDDKPVE